LEISGPGAEARAAALGITSEVQAALVEEFGGELIAMGTLRSKIIAHLGEPTFSDARTLRYDLGVRPEHLFEFQLSPDGQAVIDSNYTRREHRELELRLPTSHEDAKLIRARVIELGVTATELREALGEPEPEDRMGWWPYESWMYPGGLTLELRLGVVEG
jgi:hypothetical protein